MNHTEEHQTSNVSIVRFISSDNEDTSRIVRRALVQHFQNNNHSTSQENDTHDDDNNEVISLSNKYFTAKVQFLDIGSTTSSTTRNHLSSAMEDGIILTFQDFKTHSLKESFDRLDSIHTLAQSLQQCGDKLRLCIGIVHSDNATATTNTHTSNNDNDDDRNSLYEEEYQRRILWCLDRGYEYIEADLSEEGMKSGHGDREKEGYARILEAFEATLWSSAIRVSTTNNSMIRPKSSQNEKTLEVSSLKETTLHGKSDTNNQNYDETYFEDLDTAMKEALRIRNDARSGILNDEERKKRAGDAAMNLMKLLQQMGLDEEDGEEEDSDIE